MPAPTLERATGGHATEVSVNVQGKAANVDQNLTSAEVLHGDAFDLFKTVSRDSVDLIVTSPPYWGHREYGLGHNWDFFNNIQNVRKIGAVTKGYDWYRSNGGVLGLEPYPEWYVTHLAEIFDNSVPCVKSSGSVWINVGDTYFARWASIRESGRQGLKKDTRFRRKTPLGGIRQEKQLLLIPARFAIEMQNRGWILRNDAIWYKRNATPRPEGDRLRNSHEHFFHFVKKPKAGRARYYYDVKSLDNNLSDVFDVAVTPGECGHTATFPSALIRPRILTSSPLNGMVLDPFCGTGRSLIVAKALGRRVLGFDNQAQYADLSRRKLEECNGSSRAKS